MITPSTTTDLLAASTSALEAGGYRVIDETSPTWNTTWSRLFEDDYNVVGVAVFNTCGELLRSWSELQGSLVELMSRRIGRHEKKAWDGYLVLVTPAIAPSEQGALEELRYNTVRLRKLVATGDDLTVPSDIERILRPLLPLRAPRGTINQASVLDMLPTLLGHAGIPEPITSGLVKAYVEQRPLMESLHETQP